ncbi:MAG: GNAT family N-acetyltransferase [Thermoplasmata archaeon]
MTVRDLRRVDAPRLIQFLKNEFPEEEALLGTRPEGVEKVVRRLFRPHVRLLLGLLRLFGRPIFRFFVIESKDRIVATTLLTFSRRAGYVSMVVVDPAYRRRGFAGELLERARVATRARGKPFVALDVLASNAPARALYEKIGYRPLRATSYFVHEHPEALLPAPANVPGLRAFAPGDAKPLAEIARCGVPTEVQTVLPITHRELTGSAWASQLLATQTAGWVIEDGTGPRAWISAAVTPATEAAHISAPIIDPSVAPELATALVRVAGAWCAARHAPRLMSMVPEENERGRAALVGTGFRDVLPIWTLYRPVD